MRPQNYGHGIVKGAQFSCGRFGIDELGLGVFVFITRNSSKEIVLQIKEPGPSVAISLCDELLKRWPWGQKLGAFSGSERDNFSTSRERLV